MSDERSERIVGNTAGDSEQSWHLLAVDTVAARLGTNMEGGLTSTEAAERLARWGRNELAEGRRRSMWAMLLDQFRSLVVGLLIAAMLLAVCTKEYLEAVSILVVILMNALIGFATEWKADRALLALKRQLVREAHVVRDGEARSIPAAELVPGDLVELAAGALVPADGRVLECQRLQAIESALTGESEPVAKQTTPLSVRNTSLGDRVNMSYLGTIIADGRGRMLVTATGPRTETGKIGLLIGDVEAKRTPLEIKLDKLGRTLVWIVLGLCVVIVAAGLARGNEPLRMLEVGISLAVAAVPEGLPAVATMTLALGMQRMARKRALVRKLPAVETLGSTTAICSDKTGTLTKNEMSVQTIVLESRRIEVKRRVAGVVEFVEDERVVDVRADSQLMLALRIAALCNDAHIELRHGDHVTLGDPTEGALIKGVEEAGINVAGLRHDYPRIDEVPFDSHRMNMITVHKSPEVGRVVFVKGAPAPVMQASDRLLTRDGIVTFDEAHRRAVSQTNEHLAGQAQRVLALAYRELSDGEGPAEYDRGLVFVGLVGLMDPLREEAAPAIATCRRAGIRTIMITGDQLATANEIARRLGLDRDVQGQPVQPVHARELEGLDDSAWKAIVENTAVFARASPEHKLRIVKALQAQGHIVAMTGDGVNDAPALKQADIGVAMGIRGTEVTKETADLIITDDNFATIVSAVEQGRIIYSNILKFIHYLFSCNFAEVLAVFLAILLGWPLPLLPLQILWLNLVTDVFPALALAVEPPAPDTMERGPRDPKEQLLEPRFLGLIAWQGLLIALLTLFAFRVGLHWYGDSADGVRHARTLAFMTLALTQIFHAFNPRSRTRSMFDSTLLFRNPWLAVATVVCLFLQTLVVAMPGLRRVLATTAPTLADFVFVSACALTPIAVVECVKLIQRRNRTKVVEV